MVVNNATDTATYNVVFNLFIYHMQNATKKFNHVWDLVKKISFKLNDLMNKEGCFNKTTYQISWKCVICHD